MTGEQVVGWALVAAGAAVGGPYLIRALRARISNRIQNRGGNNGA